MWTWYFKKNDNLKICFYKKNNRNFRWRPFQDTTQRSSSNLIISA